MDIVANDRWLTVMNTGTPMGGSRKGFGKHEQQERVVSIPNTSCYTVIKRKPWDIEVTVRRLPILDKNIKRP